MCAAVLGYRLILVIPGNYSKEKQKLLKLYSAEIILSDYRKGNNSHGDLATEMAILNPDYVLLDQQSDPANPQAHRQSTAIEILNSLGHIQIDYFVGGIGTGGHITGIGEVLKSKNADLQVIGVQPEGCDLLSNKFVIHDIQGLAVGLIPDNLNVDLINRMISVDYDRAKNMMITIMRHEGISIGISSAANIVAASDLAQEVDNGVNILTIAYDSAESYLDLF